MKAAVPDVGAALLVGGSSDIGAAILAALLPVRGSQVVLAGRPSTRRSVVAASMAGHHVHELDWDARAQQAPEALVSQAASLCGRPLDLVVVAVGCLSRALLDDTVPGAAATCQDVLTVNLVAPAGILLASIQHMAGGGGHVVVMSSASATRPRRGIAAYSVAKQGLDELAQMAATVDRRVSVHIVRPGHVRTAMTRGLPEPPLTRDSHQVARDVAAGVARGRTTIWSPPAMSAAMRVLRAMPRAIVPRSIA